MDDEIKQHFEQILLDGEFGYTPRKLLNDDKSEATLFDQSEETKQEIDNLL